MKVFDCKCCGDCCSGSMEIRLNLYDMYKMAKFLNFKNTEQLFTKKYLKLVKGQNDLDIPQIIFKKVPYAFCPFLINDLNENMELKGFCSLHPYIKPLVCILAPTSKVYNSETNKNEYDFTKPTENCPGELKGDDHSIENILQPVEKEIKYENDFFNILNIILDKNIGNYTQPLYFFSTEQSFQLTIDNCRSYFEKF